MNSKYKEDDFTDSNADVNSLDVCVLRILFRDTTHHTCQIPTHPSSRFTQQSAKNTGDDNNSVSGSNPGSFIVMMQIPIATNRRCLHPAQHCSKSSKIIRRTLRCIPSYSKLIKPRSLTLFQGF